MSVKYLVIGTGNTIASVHNKIDCANKACERYNKKNPSQPAIVAESNTDICSCVAGNQAITQSECDAVIAEQPTVSYIAKPSDSRCTWWSVIIPQDQAWWSMIIPQDQALDGNRLNAPYLRAGADLGLKAGDMLIDSEANHHRKNRGYTVVLGVCDGEKVIFIKPSAEIKRYIKLHGGQDLMHEAGDVNACIRIAVWLRRQPDLNAAIQQILNQ